MKTILQALLLTFSLTFTFGVFSQVTDSIIHTNLANNPDPDLRIDSTMFEVVPLRPSDPDAWFMHLWWSGDNGFSFAPKPKHNHIGNPGAQAKMTDITTENYGTGGPPPLTYTFTTEHEGTELPKVLGADTFLHVQTYRNAVKRDTMYLIVTYGNPTLDAINGKLRIDVGDHAEICHQPLYNGHYFPNGEQWDRNKNEVSFHNLHPDNERSLLIPVYIRPNEEEFLDMKVTMFDSLAETYSDPNGNRQFAIQPAVAHSHDPNMMIAQSDAKNNCDYRGGKIHYTVKFQNDGDAPTDYVRVECYLDDKIDLNSIDNITVPSRFYQTCNANQQIQGKYVDTCGAIWEVNYDTRVLTVEMHNIKLWSSIDPGLPRIDLARGQIEFDVKVRDNYIFGTPVVAHSEIYFDENKPISTNVVKTGCDKPISLIDGGGYQAGGQSKICKWIWWILGGLLGLILLLIILLIRSRKKRKRLLNELEKAE